MQAPTALGLRTRPSAVGEWIPAARTGEFVCPTRTL